MWGRIIIRPYRVYLPCDLKTLADRQWRIDTRFYRRYDYKLITVPPFFRDHARPDIAENGAVGYILRTQITPLQDCKVREQKERRNQWQEATTSH